MDTVSVVIPVYNRTDCIQRCLESVFAQTYPAVEVIVVDDGSTDDLATVLAPMMVRIHFVKQENQGQGAARNVGVKAASGRYLAFLDSDDWWSPEKLMEQVASVEKSGCAWSHMKTLMVAKEDGERGINERYFGDWYRGPWSGNIAQQLLQTNFICTSSVVVEKNAFIDSGGFRVDRPLQGFEDYELWLRLAAKYPINYCKVPSVCYSKHDDDAATIEEVTSQINKNDLVMRHIANNCAQIFPLVAIENRRYLFREYLFREALRQSNRKTAWHILQEMWRFSCFATRNFLNACLYLTPAPILKRMRVLIARQSKPQGSD